MIRYSFISLLNKALYQKWHDSFIAHQTVGPEQHKVNFTQTRTVSMACAASSYCIVGRVIACTHKWKGHSVANSAVSTKHVPYTGRRRSISQYYIYTTTYHYIMHTTQSSEGWIRGVQSNAPPLQLPSFRLSANLPHMYSCPTCTASPHMVAHARETASRSQVH